MNRRQFLRSATAGSLALGALGGRGLARPAKPRRKPNLLFLWTDQQRWDTLACYGNPRVRAPHLDALAARSAVFERAYVTHPVCTPSRGSVLTGLWPHQSGVTANNIPLPAGAKCFPELLGDADYRAGYIGKWHLGDELFAQHGFAEWVGTEDMYQEYFSAGRDRSTKSAYHQWLVAHGHRPDHPGSKRARKAGMAPEYFSRNYSLRQPLEFGKPAFQAERAADFISRHRADPWILHVSYLEPHTPYESPLAGQYPESEMAFSPSYAVEPDASEPVRYRLRQEYYAKKYGRKAGPTNRYQSAYYGNISAVDHSVGRILARLEELGLADDTIIVFTSDHGDMMSDHRMWEKEVFYEGAMRVPLLLRVPGLTDRGGRIAPQTSHINLVPTLLDLMGRRESGAHLPGRSVAPLLRGESLPAEPVFATWMPNSAQAKVDDEADLGSAPENQKYLDESSRLVITPDGWKLLLSDHDRPQLFNLRDDPHEMRNRHGEAAQRDTVRRLTQEILGWQARTGDSLKLA